MPKTLLVKSADVLVTMDDERREIRGGGLYVEDNRIVSVGTGDTLPATADEVFDMRGHIVLPGLVNTHHHMFQSLTRAVPAAQNCELFDWLKVLSDLDPSHARDGARFAAHCHGGTDSLGLHHIERSLLPLRQRRATRRRDRSRTGDRHALPRKPRLDERRGKPGRPAARQGGRERGNEYALLVLAESLGNKDRIR